MVHVPDVERCSGTHTTALAELVDVYPTLAELAGKGVYHTASRLYVSTTMFPTDGFSRAMGLAAEGHSTLQ